LVRTVDMERSRAAGTPKNPPPSPFPDLLGGRFAACQRSPPRQVRERSEEYRTEKRRAGPLPAFWEKNRPGWPRPVQPSTAVPSMVGCQDSGSLSGVMSIRSQSSPLRSSAHSSACSPSSNGPNAGYCHSPCTPSCRTSARVGRPDPGRFVSSPRSAGTTPRTSFTAVRGGRPSTASGPAA